MTTVLSATTRVPTADKTLLREILEEQDTHSGFIYDPTITIEEPRQAMQASDIRPEANLGSQAIVRIRQGLIIIL